MNYKFGANALPRGRTYVFIHSFNWKQRGKKEKKHLTRTLEFLSAALLRHFPQWHNIPLMKYKGLVCLPHFVRIVQKQSLFGGPASLGNRNSSSGASKLWKKAVAWSKTQYTQLCSDTRMLIHTLLTPTLPTCVNVCWCLVWVISRGKSWKMSSEVFGFFYPLKSLS